MRTRRAGALLVLSVIAGLASYGSREQGHARAEPTEPRESLAAPAARSIHLDRAAYTERLRAMWLGGCLANWTGLRTEGVRITRPFFTDDDWGKPLGRDGAPIDFVFQDPWQADDDTDIEYVYLHLLTEAQTLHLRPAQIRDGWRAHVNDFIWVSNRRARDLMERGILPPETSHPARNPDALQIDAQLTTEIFGALAPGMPARALEIAHLPIRTTARGHAAHAAEFHVLLFSLAATVDPNKPRREEIVRIVREAKAFLPDTSKAVDVIDFVLSAYLASNDENNWESTRDALARRYQEEALVRGFVYRGFTESAINLGTGLLALLFGEGDFARTVQIGTLSGWDSDNGTATMGSLVALLGGLSELHAAFPGERWSDRYHIHRTRPTLPDRLPDDPDAEDTFTEIARRMADLVDLAVKEGGGEVTASGWRIP
ncbi:ADP-ribosylglycohydrolase family protein [Polyangium sorediatum]|uniref:ADP-ribosylglycohydrolase family protein n=1 Tax=Polyangium sorediatum TaxID=889274 RepID=A0ABT6NYG3_9BACT|nr:ADP-ribosylglycohydrolase family protein [Polyangium sorediatum]MDI1433358.1 ADP-ribosylglycohydrolase family protein [Polyangium sorediatum]